LEEREKTNHTNKIRIAIKNRYQEQKLKTSSEEQKLKSGSEEQKLKSGSEETLDILLLEDKKRL
jgi:hypothetical protein